MKLAAARKEIFGAKQAAAIGGFLTEPGMFDPMAAVSVFSRLT
jgi:hypothetical protein